MNSYSNYQTIARPQKGAMKAYARGVDPELLNTLDTPTAIVVTRREARRLITQVQRNRVDLIARQCEHGDGLLAIWVEHRQLSECCVEDTSNGETPERPTPPQA